MRGRHLWDVSLSFIVQIRYPAISKTHEQMRKKQAINRKRNCANTVLKTEKKENTLHSSLTYDEKKVKPF